MVAPKPDASAKTIESSANARSNALVLVITTVSILSHAEPKLRSPPHELPVLRRWSKVIAAPLEPNVVSAEVMSTPVVSALLCHLK
jgi:hypothetical protein